jgi:hypothetical protein
MTGRRRGLGPVDLARPANLDHPLNRGRVAWWLTLPTPGGGGAIWRDLMGPGFATLSGLTAASGFRGTDRQGGFGHLLLDGSDDYAAAPQAITSSTFTLAAWVYPTRYGSSANGNGIVYQGTGSSSLGTRFGLIDSVIGVNCLFFGYEGAGSTAVSTTGAVVLNAWSHVAFTYAAGTWATYVNALLNSSGSGLSSSAPAANTTKIGFWYNSADPNRFFQGGLDDVSVWNRALSQAEVAALRSASLQGHPGLLNRRQAMSLLPAAAASGGPLPWSFGDDGFAAGWFDG